MGVGAVLSLAECRAERVGAPFRIGATAIDLSWLLATWM
jgi:hypothetical protein